MSESKTNINKDADKLFSNLVIPWEKQKEEIWEDLEARLEHNPAKVVRLYTTWGKYAAVAVILILLGTSLFMRFYTTSVVSIEGRHLSHILPDGSKVDLNAASSISYHPYWWRISRQVKFSGEGFFEVAKGKTFEVVSLHGRTTVLGTTFNIYSRKHEYVVTCIAGRVRVEAVETGNQVILNPDEKAVLDKHGIFEISYNIDSENTVSWVNNQFIFTSVPLYRVIEEISRQYGVKIKHSLPQGYSYSGGFSKNNSVEEVLNLVCKPFGINFVANGDGVYVLKQNN